MKGATPGTGEGAGGRTDFNPRTREGCDSLVSGPAPFVGISIHAPVKGATILRYKHGKIPDYFNPRTREGCDTRPDVLDLKRRIISIHAPVKGATPHGAPGNLRPRISIHAPVKGATRIHKQSFALSYPISIHAPVKGATTHRYT